MRRMIWFLLILAFCVSLACPAFAAVKSPAENGPASSNPKTGDIILFWGVVMLVSLAALGLLYVIYRKRFCR